ncbi:hypothetical protein FRC07_006250 [Ceratobasidium sp. 392]|nr:hypothetical protein FRC07_006250 [Ceratobasidium sp. 392]
MAGSTKRKSTDTTEPTSETNKRTRGLSASCGTNATSSSSISVPETILEAEHESATLPRTPVNKSFVEDSVTPTQTAQLGSISTPLPPTTPVNAPTQGSQVTPLILSSSNVDPACVNPSESMSRTYQYPNAEPKTPTRSQRSLQAVLSNTTTRLDKPEMEEILKYELCGHVFKHRQFFKEFLVPDKAIQAEVRNRIVASGGLRPNLHLGINENDNHWTIHGTIARQRNEKAAYGVLADMLNVIGRAAYETYGKLYPEEQFRQSYRPFHNHSNCYALWDSPSDAATAPDLVMGQMDPDQKGAHWGDMELLVECKSISDKDHRREAYLQLARYARTVFAHQIYRLRVFGFSLCGSIVNFVCFDRSGLLHSVDIDLSVPAEAHSFVEHIITLLTISPDKFGYDTRYSFRRNNERQMVETLFKFDDDHDPLVVSELLCYRKCCCGRATCVCALGEDLVHKSIWRPDDRDDEGVTLSLFEGVFGVCQVKASNHDKHSTKLDYPDELVESDFASFFRPRKRTDTSVAGTSASSTRNTKNGRPSASDKHRSNTAPVSGPTPRASVSRGIRIKSDILMPRGMSLFDAQSPLHLVMAIHDALLGIMAFTEAGKIHCDISAYNLLLINPEKHYGKNGWEKTPKGHLNPDVWNMTGKGIIHAPDDVAPTAETSTSQSTSHRLKHITKLKRGPVCVIHDTEFTVNEDKKRNKPHGDRTGTPAFISAQLLDGFLSKRGPPVRTFMHDVESLLWILIWVVAHRSQDETEWKVNDTAKDLISNLSQNNLASLSEKKQLLLHDQNRLVTAILGLENDWSKALVPIIQSLAKFLFVYLYAKPALATATVNHSDSEESDSEDYNLAGAAEESLMEKAEFFHEIYNTEPRVHTFVRLFKIFNKEIRMLKSKCPAVDLTRF